jgi:hypothetical protein
VKRDDDLLRALLLEFEGQADWLILVRNHLNMSAEDRVRQYHVHLLSDAGMVTAVGSSTYRMTNAGHDYLDAIRQDGIWAKTKQAVAETGGTATLEIMKSLAIGFLKTKIEKHTGIAL